MKKTLLMLALLANAICANAEDYILYTTSDDNALTGVECFILDFVANTYENGQGRIICEGEVKRVGNFAFSGNSTLTSMVIPNSVTEIGTHAFYGCTNLTSFNIPNLVTTIREHAFDRCASLTSIEFPESVTTIGEGAFSWCTSLTSIKIPKLVTTIETMAFCGCGHLESIVIPELVTKIERLALSGCSSLSEITLLNNIPPVVASTSLNNIPTETCVLRVPAESVSAYRSASGWKNFKNIVAIDANGIDKVSNDSKKAVAWTLNGLQAADTYKGIVIRNGRKTVKR